MGKAKTLKEVQKMKFELNELIALTEWYFEDMKKHGFEFLDNQISEIRIVDNTSACAFTSFNNTDYKNDTSEVFISFNQYYVEDTTIKSLRNTIVHELCHCLKGTLREVHGKHWKAWAKKASSIYNLDISTYAKSEKCIGMYKHKKYMIVCPQCGIIGGNDRLTVRMKYQYRQHQRACKKCGSCVDLIQNR